MGIRVPVADIRQMTRDLFSVAAKALKPGGRLVFVNPLSMATPHPSLKLQFQQKVDLGGFNRRIEKYFKAADFQTGRFPSHK